jgi:hypothetical protein
VLTLQACKSSDVQTDHRAAGFGRDALRGSTVVLLPAVTAHAAGLSADLDRAAAGGIGSAAGLGRLVEPGEVLDVARTAGVDQQLGNAVERFRTTRQVDADAIQSLNAAVREQLEVEPDYFALVRLQDLQSQANPSLSSSLRDADGGGGGGQSARPVYAAGATVRLAIVRAADGEPVFVGVTAIQREGTSISGPSARGALPNHPFSAQETSGGRRDVRAAALTDVVWEAVAEIIRQMPAR